MKKIILCVDNVPKNLQTLKRWLTALGYAPILASTIEEARELLRQRYCHVIMADVRMRDDLNPDDFSGFELINDGRYGDIPKIVLTSYPALDKYGPDIINRDNVRFLYREDSPEKHEAIISQLFRDKVAENFDLDVYFEAQNPASFDQMAALPPNLATLELASGERALAAGERALASGERALVVEALFRQLFANSRHLVIGETITAYNGAAAVKAFAYGDNDNGAPSPFVVLFGDNGRMQLEIERFPEWGAEMAGQPRLTRRLTPKTSVTVRQATAVAYNFLGGDLEGAVSLRQCVAQSNPEQAAAALDNLAACHLQSLRQRALSPAQRDDVYYLDQLKQRYGAGCAALLAANIEALVARANNAGIAQIALHPEQKLIWRLDKERAQELPYPAFSGLPYTALEPTAWRMAHGRLTGDTILVAPNQRVCLINFADCRLLPASHDLAFLELSLREMWSELPDPAVWLGMEAHLHAPAENTVPTGLERFPVSAKTLQAVQQLRRHIEFENGLELRHYYQSLYYLALSQLLSFEAERRYTERPLRQYTHTLLLAAYLLSVTEKAPPAETALTVNKREEKVCVNGDWIKLSQNEFNFFLYLWERVGEVCASEEIHDFVYKMDLYDRGNLHTLASRVRKKLGFDRDWPIENVTGIGYKLIHSG